MHAVPTAQTTHYGMNTPISHAVFGANAQAALDAGTKRLRQLEELWSRFNAKSEISRINTCAGKKAVHISAETSELLALSKQYSTISDGMFTVTICPLVDLWDVKHARQAPNDKDIARILDLVNDADLLLNPSDSTAQLNLPHQSIDLGGIGKGFACDEVNKVYTSYGITSAVTNIGGNVSVLGAKPNGTPWRVGIRHPRKKECLLGRLLITNRSVVTSADDQRFFVSDNGKRYHHILDPRSGSPADSGLLSVTVITESSAAADALSTILFIAGLEDGTRILKHFPGAEAVFCTQDQHVYLTSGLKGTFQADVSINASYI